MKVNKVKKFWAVFLSLALLVIGTDLGGQNYAFAAEVHSVDFSDGTRIDDQTVTYTVGEASVTLSITKTITDGVAELTNSDVMTLTGFDPETMEVSVYASDGFTSTLTVTDNTTSLAAKKGEGGLPNPIKLKVKAKSSTPPSGDPPAGPPSDPKTLTVSLTAPEGLSHGIRFDGRSVEGGSVQVESGKSSYTVDIGVEFGKAISKIIINGEEIDPIPPENEGWITLENVAAADAYTIVLSEGESDDVTMLWVYDQATADEMEFGDDAVVTNGKVELVSIRRGGETIYNGEPDTPGVLIDDKSGYVMLKKRDDVVVKLIPNYGYQLKNVSINGTDLTPQESVSTFEIQNIQGNIHFSGAFIKAEDIATSGSEVATSPKISDGRNAVSSGNLKLTIGDNSTYNKDVTSAIAGGAGEKVASLDLTLDNIVSKGNGTNWTRNITEFTNPITITMDVSSDGLEEGESYGIVRDHNGVLKELDATYENGKLSFKTNQFSTYTLVKKYQTKAVVTKITDANITDALRAKGLDTVAKIESKLEETLKQSGATVISGNVEFVDVKLQMKKDGVWVDVDASNFPPEGLEIEIPFDTSKIPAGATVTVGHMFGSDVPATGARAGEVEILSGRITANGIAVTTKGCSPFMISWAEEASSAGKPATGDNGNIIWLAVLMMASLSTMSVLGINSKKRSKSVK